MWTIRMCESRHYDMSGWLDMYIYHIISQVILWLASMAGNLLYVFGYLLYVFARQYCEVHVLHPSMTSSLFGVLWDLSGELSWQQLIRRMWLNKL